MTKLLKHIASKAKAYAALVGSVLTAAAGVLTDSKPLALAAAVVTALAVYRFPNTAPTDAPSDEYPYGATGPRGQS